MKLSTAMQAELRSLEHAGGGIIVTDAVVTAARDPSSSLHKLFDWNVEAAAMEHWRQRARQIVQVYVEVLDVGADEPRTIRTYVSVSTEGQRAYQPTIRVLRENRAAIVLRVCDRLVAHIHAYPLPEFDDLLLLIDQIRAAASRPRPRPRPGRGSGRRRGGREHRPHA